jgi:hypothetical protein
MKVIRMTERQTPSLADLHRQVSSHVLSNLPVKPERANTLPWPIAFLTDKCKNSSDEDKSFDVREKKVSKSIFGWKKGLDEVVAKKIQQMYEKPTWTSDGNIYPPFVIRAQSGFGKSILLGKLVAELISAKHNSADSEDTIWPKFDRILFSQLKDSRFDYNLEESICNGLDLGHRCKNLYELFEKVNVENKIIFIDSLDEHEDKMNWWEISRRLSDKGWIVVWTCRDPDWSHHKLGNVVTDGGPIPNQIADDLLKSKEDGKLPWDQFHGKDWSLEIDSKFERELVELTETNNENKPFMQYCYSETQLMHIFHTNFAITKVARDSLQKGLCENLLSNLEERVEEFSGRKSEMFQSDDWSISLFSSNLVNIIIQTAINYAKKKFPANDINELWAGICKDYYEKESAVRNESELNESINVKKLSENQAKLFNLLLAYGIFREGGKFRHRDFATIAFIEGCGGLERMKIKEKNDILFKHFFPNSLLKEENKELIDDVDGPAVIQDFIRRNGNILVYLDPIANLDRDDLWNEYYIPKRSIDIHGIIPMHAEEEAEEETALEASITDGPEKAKEKIDDLSSLQIQALSLGQQSDHSVILKGFPGSGKTYTGVEAIIIRQASLFRSGRTDAYSLIVALNDQLADSIATELEDNHKRSKYLKEFTDTEKSIIIGKIHVRSLKKLIEDWAPDFRGDKTTDNWLIDGDILNEFFIDLDEDLSNWRMLEKHYQTKMFGLRSGKFLALNDYLKHVADDKRDLCTKWHEQISRARDSGLRSIIECCTVLRNRLLRNEYIKSGTEVDSKTLEIYSVSISREEKNNDYFAKKYEDSFTIRQKRELVKDEWINKKVEEVKRERKIEEESIIDTLKKKIQQKSYDIVLIDEVQDLPPMASIMLSFLCANRASTSHYNRFILAGDHLQTLNGQEFKWKTFLNTLTDLTKGISEDFDHIFIDPVSKRPTQHHLRGLYWSEQDRMKTLKHHLKENHRNAPEIMELTKDAWKQWHPDDGGEDLDAMTSNWKRDEPLKCLRIMEIETNSAEGFVNNVKLILAAANAKANVSLLYTNNVIRDFVKEEIMDKDKDKKTWAEYFDPWTIKGLERDTVIIIGPYTSSDKDPDSRTLFNAKAIESVSVTGEMKGAIDLMRRKMLVSTTRAVDKLIILHAPKDSSKLAATGKYQIKSLNPPRISPKIDTDRVIEISKDQVLIDKDLEGFFNDGFGDLEEDDPKRKGHQQNIANRKKETSIITISEGMELIARAKTASAKEDLKYFHGRLMTVLEQDPHDSWLRKILQKLIDIEVKPITVKKKEVERTLQDSLLLREILNFEKAVEPLPSKYKKLDTSKTEYLKSKAGPWGNNGFGHLYAIIKTLFYLNENMKKIEQNSIDVPDNVQKDVNKLLKEIKRIFKNTQRELGLPSFHLTENELSVFLISVENNIILSDKYNKFNNKEKKKLIFKLMDSLTEKMVVDGDGEIMANFENHTAPLRLKVNYWNDFITASIGLGKRSDAEKEKMLSFSKKYLKLYSLFFNKQMDGKISTTPAQKDLYKGAIELLVKQNSPAGFNSSRSEIKHYVNSGCPGISKEKIEEFIIKLADKHKDILKTMFSDIEILEWRIHQFSAFIESLHNESEERAQKLAQKSRYVERFLHNQMIIRSEGDISLHTVKESSERYLSENIETNAYETLINIMIKSNLNSLAVNSKNYNRESLEKIILARTLMPIKTPGFAKLLTEIPSSKKLEFKLYKIIDMNHWLGMFVGDIGGENEKHSAWELIKDTILIRGIGDIESEKKFDSIDNYPAIQLSKAFGVEQSNIFSKKEQIGVEENIEIVNNIYSNWTVHKKIFDLFSDDDEDTSLDWRFDGFGKDRKGNFSESIKQNEKFLQALDVPFPSPETNQYILLESFNLGDRYEKYIQVIDTLLHYIDKNTSDTINLSTLIQQMIFGIGKTTARPFEEVINLEITPNESTGFEANVFPCNCMPKKHSCWGAPIKFKKAASTVEIIGTLKLNEGIVNLILELGVKINRVERTLSEKNIEDSISNLTDTRTNLASFITGRTILEGQNILEDIKLLQAGREFPKIHPRLIGPGDKGRLKSESPFTIVGSQEGNSRMAIVSGDEGSEERKPILMTDVAYVVKDGKAYEIEPADYEAMPVEDDDEAMPVEDDDEAMPEEEDEEPSYGLWWQEPAESRSLRELLSQRIKSGDLSKEQIEGIRAILEGKEEDGE